MGLARAGLAAAGRGAAPTVDDNIYYHSEGSPPAHVKTFGTTKEEVFADLPELRWLYGEKADSFSTGAIGVYSYLKRIAFGLRHFAALNRKFDIGLADPSDLIPLTPSARDILRGTWF